MIVLDLKTIKSVLWADPDASKPTSHLSLVNIGHSQWIPAPLSVWTRMEPWNSAPRCLSWRNPVPVQLEKLRPRASSIQLKAGLLVMWAKTYTHIHMLTHLYTYKVHVHTHMCSHVFICIYTCTHTHNFFPSCSFKSEILHQDQFSPEAKFADVPKE